MAFSFYEKIIVTREMSRANFLSKIFHLKQPAGGLGSLRYLLLKSLNLSYQSKSKSSLL